MGRKALDTKRQTVRKIHSGPVPAATRQLLMGASYRGSPVHKANPGDFGLTPPTSPRPDKTLCDEAEIFREAEANALFALAIRDGLVSVGDVPGGFPKQLWVVDGQGRVFEAMHGGTRAGCYHGYPIRKSDPLFDQVVKRWEQRQ